ncbi:MAG: hypothetical protein KKB50_19045 [Planctomycetes bacterium]|nr:hypothetical protein [Planctomycetota bacterium]
MKRTLISVIVLSIFLCGTAPAQIPGKLKQAAREALKAKTDQEKQKADESATGDQSGARPAASKDKDRKYAPGVSYSSLLEGVKLLPKDGQFGIHHIQATFVPDDCKGGFVVLRTADGKELCQWDWKPDRLKKPYTLLGVTTTTDLTNNQNVPSGRVPLTTPGDYVLDFYLPTEHFYTYPFSVTKIGGDDPFGEGQCYVLKGDWRSWGYLYYSDAKPDQNLEWKVWLRHDGCAEKDVKIAVEISRDQDGELVCTGREGTTYSLKPDWVRYAFDMVFPKGKEVPHGTYFKAKDLLNTDGAYTLTMKIDGESYGVWKFVIEGNKLKYKGRAVRGEAAPLTFIEGGRDAWWYGKE